MLELSVAPVTWFLPLPVDQKEFHPLFSLLPLQQQHRQTTPRQCVSSVSNYRVMIYELDHLQQMASLYKFAPLVFVKAIMIEH
jgi:hypothetical protein